MELAFNKIIVDSRHAAIGTSTSFDITLPQTLNLGQDAVMYVTDVCLTNTFSSFGDANGSLDNTFYWIERIGDANAVETYLNRAVLDATIAYEAFTLATELQTKMNAATVFSQGNYTVSYDVDRGVINIARPQEANTVNSFTLANDDLLQTPEFQASAIAATTSAKTPYVLNYSRPRSCMKNFGLGTRSTENSQWSDLQALLESDASLSVDLNTGAIDVRRDAAVYLHNTTLTNFKSLGPSGSRTCIAKIPVLSGYGSVLYHQHAGSILDCTPVGGVSLSTINFDLRSSSNQPLSLRGGHISVTLLFGQHPMT